MEKKKQDTGRFPSSAPELGNFSARLKEAMGGMKPGTFSKLAALDNKSVRAYLKGEWLPKRLAVEKISKASGYTVEWLETGRGLKHAGVEEERAHYNSPPSVDVVVLTQVITLVESHWGELALPTSDKAELIAFTYSNTISGGKLDVQAVENITKWLKNRGLR